MRLLISNFISFQSLDSFTGPWKSFPLNFYWIRFIRIHDRKSVIEKGDNILLPLYVLLHIYIFQAVKQSEHCHAVSEFSCLWPIHLFSSTTCGEPWGLCSENFSSAWIRTLLIPLTALPYQLQVKLSRHRLKQTPQDSAEPLAWGFEDELALRLLSRGPKMDNGFRQT